MLIITRKLGEGLNIGKHLIITILNIDYVDKQIKLGVNGSECITIDKRKSKVISDGITITVMRIGSKQVKLGINVPENLKIHRNKVQRKNTHLKTKYLTNREGIPNQQLQGKKMSKILIVDDNPDTDLPPLFVPPLKLEFVFIQIVGA
jgi:carbon storage regulator CsrA